jgi:hypothetical protein
LPVSIAILIGDGTKRLARKMRAFAAGGVLAAVLIVPMALPYFAARQAVGERPLEEIEFYSATPRNYLAAHHTNVLFGPHTAAWGGQERELFMGIIVPLLALVGLWPSLSAARIAYAIGLVVAFDISLGFNGVTYPWLHDYVLPYRGLRVPARMAMVVGLALSVLAGYGMARLYRSIRNRTVAITVLVALTALVSLEYRSRPPLKKIFTTPPGIYAALPPGPNNVLLELPLLFPDIVVEPMYMYFSTFHWTRLLNGYSGFSPPSYYYLREALTSFPDSKSLDELGRRGLTHVVVNSAFCEPGQFDDIVGRIEHSGHFERVAATQWEKHPVHLYRLLDSWRTSSATGVK